MVSKRHVGATSRSEPRSRFPVLLDDRPRYPAFPAPRVDVRIERRVRPACQSARTAGRPTCGSNGGCGAPLSPGEQPGVGLSAQAAGQEPRRRRRAARDYLTRGDADHVNRTDRPFAVDAPPSEPAIARTADGSGCKARHVRTGASLRIHGTDPRDELPGLGWTESRHGAVWTSSVEPADDVELDVPLRTLLTELESAPEALDALRERGAEFDFFCYLGSRSAEHCAILDADLLGRIAAIPAEVWLDVYAED